MNVIQGIKGIELSQSKDKEARRRPKLVGIAHVSHAFSIIVPLQDNMMRCLCCWRQLRQIPPHQLFEQFNSELWLITTEVDPSVNWNFRRISAQEVAVYQEVIRLYTAK